MNRLPFAFHALFLLAPGSSPALEPPPLTPLTPLTIVWHDGSRLFPPFGLGLLQNEVEELFRKNGLSVRFRAAARGGNPARMPEPRVNVVLLPDERGPLRVSSGTMAAMLSERGGKKSTIFVFHSRVRRTLGHRSERTPRELAELSRALARILAHEVVHVLAPERGHADSGLMTPSLVRKDLLGDLPEIDEESIAMARGTLERIGGRGPARSFPISEAAAPRSKGKEQTL